MSEPDRPVTEEDILRYVDGQSDPSRREAIERHLQSDAQDAQAVSAYRHQNRLLREAFDGILEERVPERIVATALAVRPAYARPIWAIAAGLVLFIAGAASGWYVAGRSGDHVATAAAPDFKSYALIAHRIYTPEVRHPVEVAANEEAHLVQWLSKRLGHPLKSPQLSQMGFELVGGRLLAAPDGQPAAHFMYQDRGMRRLTLYVRRAEAGEPTAFRFARGDDNTRMFYWIDAPFAYALVGSIEREELYKISATVYDQLSQ
jgi:anti-sigma factor RsiW